MGLRCERIDRHVVIEVSDSGIGIEPEASARIFDAFEQGERSITRQFGGLGLGLSIAKRLVEMHDGTISVQSNGRNQGATFRVQLPLSTDRSRRRRQGKRASFRGARAAYSAGRGQRRYRRHDEDGAGRLRLRGGDCRRCGTSAATASSAKFDLLISDLGLPDRSGIELMQELRQRRHNLKGIALSGYGQQEDLRRSKEAGFSVHLVKPVDADLLLETIAGLV